MLSRLQDLTKLRKYSSRWTTGLSSLSRLQLQAYFKPAWRPPAVLQARPQAHLGKSLCPSKTPTPYSLYCRFAFNSSITALVGPQEHKFVIHRDPVCAKSKMFAKSFLGSFQEAETGIIRLEDIPVCLFRIFVSWLYDRRLQYARSDPLVSANDEFAMVVSPKTNADEQQPETWPFFILVRLFLLGDRFDAWEFRTAAIDAMIQERRKTQKPPRQSVINHAFEHTTEGSPLRKLLIHMHAYHTKRCQSASRYYEMPVEFLAGMVVVMTKRTTAEQCYNCHQKALKIHKIKSDDPDICQDKDHPPWECDPCFYHDHKTDEEGTTCHQKRKCKKSDA